MLRKGWNIGTYITPEIRSQDDKKLPQWYCRRQDQHITGSYSIQYEEVDEVKERRNTQLNFSLDLSGTYFVSSKYPTLMK
jgi:hypothetical protein